jgi:hypothetical protein
LLVESLVVLFSSRLSGETHILAAFMLDHEVAERYHFCRHAAEAKLPYFSWHWRFAVIFSVAKVIFGEHADSTCSGFCPDSSQVFFELLQHLPWEDHIHIFTASRTWPKRLQDDFGRANVILHILLISCNVTGVKAQKVHAGVSRICQRDKEKSIAISRSGKSKRGLRLLLVARLPRWVSPVPTDPEYGLSRFVLHFERMARGRINTEIKTDFPV